MTCILDRTSLGQTRGHRNIALSRHSIALRGATAVPSDIEVLPLLARQPCQG